MEAQNFTNELQYCTHELLSKNLSIRSLSLRKLNFQIIKLYYFKIKLKYILVLSCGSMHLFGPLFDSPDTPIHIICFSVFGVYWDPVQYTVVLLGRLAKDKPWNTIICSCSLKN